MVVPWIISSSETSTRQSARTVGYRQIRIWPLVERERLIGTVRRQKVLPRPEGGPPARFPAGRVQRVAESAGRSPETSACREIEVMVGICASRNRVSTRQSACRARHFRSMACQSASGHAVENQQRNSLALGCAPVQRDGMGNMVDVVRDGEPLTAERRVSRDEPAVEGVFDSRFEPACPQPGCLRPGRGVSAHRKRWCEAWPNRAEPVAKPPRWHPRKRRRRAQRDPRSG